MFAASGMANAKFTVAISLRGASASPVNRNLDQSKGSHLPVRTSHAWPCIDSDQDSLKHKH